MPNIDKLSDQATRALLAREAQYERKIAAVLRRALDEIRAVMAEIYEEYAVKEKGVTIVEVLTKADMARYGRYAAMEKAILDKLNPAIKANLATLKRLQPEQYNAAFFQSAWVIDNAAAVRLNWGIINTKAIRAAYAITDPENKEMNIALKNYSMNARTRIRRAINDGLAQGKSYLQMAKDLKIATDKIYSSAITIVRTEGGSAVAAGTADAYDRALEQGVEGNVTWSSTLDSKTRPANKYQIANHREMDGQVRDKDGLFHFKSTGETAPYPLWEGLSAAQRCNCRCRIRMDIEGYSPELRRTRENGLIPYQTYEQWQENYGPIEH
jgi:hypothetical protein